MMMISGLQEAAVGLFEAMVVTLLVLVLAFAGALGAVWFIERVGGKNGKQR